MKTRHSLNSSCDEDYYWSRENLNLTTKGKGVLQSSPATGNLKTLILSWQAGILERLIPLICKSVSLEYSEKKEPTLMDKQKALGPY